MPSISRYINVLSRASGMFRGANMKNQELRPYLQNYILVLTRCPGLSQEQIARKLCVDKSSVTRALASLEKIGYVTRVRDEADKRITLVYPTEKAIESRAEIKNAYKEWNSYIKEGFTAEEEAEFIRLLEKAAKRAAEYAETELDGVDFSEEATSETEAETK